MTLLDSIKIRRGEITQIAARHGACCIRVVGSVARGEERPDSDVDLLVSMEHGRDLLDLVALEQDLGAALHREVDVLTDEGLSPYLKDQIQAEAVTV
ncbi:MAG: nucleotidyltransferase [Verrucomicrobia bacterium]|nr:MAG: nucleotidyltransferase [Verrucomicrobiota bacterium]